MVEAVRARARLNQRDKDGVSFRRHIEKAAKRGNAQYQRYLDAEHDLPDSLAYLADIFDRLDTMRDYDMNGPRRFTPAHIAGGMALFGWSLSPREVDALVVLDAASLSPGKWPDEEAVNDG